MVLVIILIRCFTPLINNNYWFNGVYRNLTVRFGERNEIKENKSKMKLRAAVRRGLGDKS